MDRKSPFPFQNSNWHLSVSICLISCSCHLISVANKRPAQLRAAFMPKHWALACCTQRKIWRGKCDPSETFTLDICFDRCAINCCYLDWLTAKPSRADLRDSSHFTVVGFELAFFKDLGVVRKHNWGNFKAEGAVFSKNYII